jgi:ribonuclease Y
MTVVLVVALVVVAAIAVGASVLTVMSLRRGSGVVNSAPAGPSLESTHLEVAELRSRAEADAAETRRRAQEQADLLDEARHAHEAEVQALKAELRELRSDLERREHRLAEREARIDESQRRVEFRDRELVALDAQIARHRAELEDVAEERRLVLERTAGLTAEAAKAELVSAMAKTVTGGPATS